MFDRLMPETAKIVVASTKAKPAIHLGSTGLVFHLTNGFDKSKLGQVNHMSHAWTADGQVEVLSDMGALSFAGWDFGFIQFQEIKTGLLWYAGQVPEHGMIEITYAKAPALTQTLLLDSDADFSPWTADKPRFTMSHTVTQQFCSASTGDHQMSMFGFTIKNDKTNELNYLHTVVDERQFWTVFVAKDPKGNFIHLAHFKSKLKYAATIKWRAGKPTLFTSPASKDISFETPVKGAPTDKNLQTLLKTPKGPQANTTVNFAIKLSVQPLHSQSKAGNRSDSIFWNDFIAKDFYM